jgi:hypothetical protein
MRTDKTSTTSNKNPPDYTTHATLNHIHHTPLTNQNYKTQHLKNLKINQTPHPLNSNIKNNTEDDNQNFSSISSSFNFKTPHTSQCTPAHTHPKALPATKPHPQPPLKNQQST